MRDARHRHSARRSLLSGAFAVLFGVGLAVGGPPNGMDAVSLTNFHLSPAYSQWLLGPISWMAKDGEIEAYLALDEDAEAQAFIERFWGQRSNPDSPWPTDQPRAVFERRLGEADTRFSEGTKIGRWTDRGTIYILYGEPDNTYYEVPERPRNSPRAPEPVEVWSYSKDSPRGLDGEKPKRKYFFVKRGEATVFNYGR